MARMRMRKQKERDFYRARRKKRGKARLLIAGVGKDMDRGEKSPPGAL